MSVRRDGSYVRSKRLLEIAKHIALDFNFNQKSNVEDRLCVIMLNMGLTEKRAMEYIELVCRARGWIIKDGFIYPGDLNE